MTEHLMQDESIMQIERKMQPEYVIPFRITKEAALENLRRQMKLGPFVPDDFLGYEMKIIPAYVPFWLLDISYEDQQIWKYRGDRYEASKYAKAGGMIRLDQFSVDGVYDLEDVITCGLGPYDYSQLVPNSQIMPVEDVLQEECQVVECEVGREEAEKTATKMIQAAFNREIQKRLDENGAEMLRTEPVFRVDNSTLALLPIWFCIIYADDGDFIAYVNGQTGKVVYVLPAAREETVISFAKTCGAIVGGLSVMMCLFFWHLFTSINMNESSAWIILSTLCLPIMILLAYFAKESWKEGKAARQKYMLHLSKVNAAQNLSFLKMDL
ncbi:MAG: hypothetical protein K6F51_13670 [Acetatifactor sp.]|nr:hypothetical protein [Acetatifactor sp.]